MRPIQALKFNLNQNFWEDPDDEGRVQKPESTVLDYTPIEAESLLKDYSTSGSKGIHQKNITLDGREGTLSVSRTHNSLLKKGGEVPKITFYPRSEAWVNQMNQDWAKAEFAANLPLHLAPFASLATGGAAIAKTQYRQNPAFRANVNRTISKGMQFKKNIRSADIFNPGQITVNATPISGKPIPAETSASVLGKSSIFRTGSKAERRIIQQRLENQAVQDALTGKPPEPGKPYAMAYENVKPSNTAIHRVVDTKDKTALRQQIGDWLGRQKKNFNVKTINKEFGFINDVTKGYQLRIKTTGAEKYLKDIKDPDEAVRKAAIQHIKLEKVPEKNTNRAETQDIGKIDVVTEHVERMNAAWDGTKGIDPEVLNPKILRKVVNQGARLKDKITTALSKQLGIKLQKEHMFGIRSREGFGQDAAIAQHPGEAGFNNLLSKLALNNAFSRETGYELGMPTHGYSQEELAKMHPRRRAELENLGALEVLAHYGMMSNQPDVFKNEIQGLKDQLKGIQEGDPNVVPTTPGRIVTDSDLLKIQQLSHKGMDSTVAAETVLAQREALNRLLDAGLDIGPKELEVLKKTLTHIEIDTKIRRAKKDTNWKPRFDPNLPYTEWPTYKTSIEKYPSDVTGKPVQQRSMRKLLEKLNRLYHTN